MVGTNRRAPSLLLGTLALTRCSGGNDVTGINTVRASDPQTPAPPAVTATAPPTPHLTPTPRPCPPRFGDDCGGFE